jgi:hypothetical protein
MNMATEEIISLVCDLHDGDEVAGAVPVWFGLGGQLYQIDACPGCAARLRDALEEFLTRARLAGAVPDWLPRPDAPAGRAVTAPRPKRDLILSVLRNRIADGTYPPGSYLPTQRDLAAEHGMSVTPVQSACWQLENDGMLSPADRGRYTIEAAAPGTRRRKSQP